MDFSLLKSIWRALLALIFWPFVTLKSVSRILLHQGKGWSILDNIQQIRANFGLEIRLQIISQVDCNVCLKNILKFERKRKFSDFVRKKGIPFLKGKVASLVYNITIKSLMHVVFVYIPINTLGRVPAVMGKNHILYKKRDTWCMTVMHIHIYIYIYI